jgi:hypothetical protein
MTLAEKLTELSKTLPPAALSELVDFAEFLQARAGSSPVAIKRPLIELAGGLESSTTFAGNPLEIQQEMRREWN